jgi:hypothetical protein
MEIIYDEMRSRNNDLVNKYGIKCDKLLLNKEPDNRLCLAIFSNIKGLYLSDIYGDLEPIRSTCIYYPKNKIQTNGTLHFTLMQLIGFNDFNELEDPSVLEKIIPIIKDMLPLKIKYKGIILTPTGIVLCGYPDKDINSYRDKIRKELRDIIREPYYNNICHSTLCRFTGEVDIQQIQKNEEKYKEYVFGEIEINSFNIGYGTWKLNEYEIKVLYNTV